MASLPTTPCPVCAWECPGRDPADENGLRVCPACGGQTVVPGDDPEPYWLEPPGDLDLAATRLTPGEVESLRRQVTSLSQYVDQAEAASNPGLSGAGLKQILKYLAIHTVELGELTLGLQKQMEGGHGD
jgi:hypothetical protein